MNVISIISQKGGAGKTTLAVHLATYFAQLQLNTVLVDLDPQASASEWSDRRAADTPVVISTHAQRTIFARSLLYGKTAMEAEPKSKAATELRALAESVTHKLSSLGEQ